MSTDTANKLFRRILVPHDFSEHATRALEVAVGLAEAGGVVTVVHAVAPVYSATGGPAADLAWTPTPEMVSDVKRSLVRLIERALGRTGAAEVRCRVVLADPLTAILAAARAADLIVMTTVGRTGLGHLLMGSVAEKVVRHAKVPVLTLHPNMAKRLARRRARAGTATAARKRPRHRRKLSVR
jgi:nucleotide-binding universal stress UspA family protein